MPTNLKLTPKELECLMDRLCQPDIIAEVLSDDVEDEQAQADRYQEVFDAAESLWNTVDQSGELPETVTPIEADILQDAVDGSTYAASVEDHRTQALSAAIRVGDSLARKVSALIGRTVHFPAE